MARDFNRLSLAVLASMAHDRPLCLTLGDETELVGVPVASRATRKGHRTVEMPDFPEFSITRVEKASWV